MLLDNFKMLDNDEIDVLYELYYSIFTTPIVTENKHYSSKLINGSLLLDPIKFIMCLDIFSKIQIDDNDVGIHYLGLLNENEFFFKATSQFLYQKQIEKKYRLFSKNALIILQSLQTREEKLFFVYLTTRCKRKINISYAMFVNDFGFKRELFIADSMVMITKKILPFLYKYFIVKGFSFVYRNDKLYYFNVEIESIKEIN
ncbi:hypothetical protein A9K75_09155 [Campylobacter fetus subsp. testudinum]|uniref:hypothetical protein n=1 Tax=Campylobacter fetus TaxID=196 RepID=UPI0008187640|nr:hypothetical protein [Campylobacter fetus]OCR98951.1 hypothetical protein A9K75_09155 [Campylobacter fetus subsp. testudinum]